MEITERQKSILDIIVETYINSAQPISSQLLEKNYDFDICPATIRIEMQKLTDSGFIFQPHTSAGRVPTDKGYRFFVDNLKLDERISSEIFKEIEKEIEDSFKFTQIITKKLSDASSVLVFCYLADEKVLCKEGWREALQEPEFKESNYVSRFLETIDNFEKNIDKFFSDFPEDFQVYIGSENPIPKAKDFSLITSKAKFPKKEKGMVAMLGPKRMAYQKNINLVNALNKVLEEF